MAAGVSIVATVPVILLLLVQLGSVEGEASGACDNNNAPHYVSVECAIAADSPCQFQNGEEIGHLVDWCTASSYGGCLAYVGIELHVTCRVDRESAGSVAGLQLYRDNRSLGSNASWSFARPEAGGGEYECRWDNGSLFARGSVYVFETVYVIPGVESGVTSDLSQSCVTRLVGEFNCSLDHTPRNYFDNNMRGKLHSIPFTVLGTRPVNLSVDVLWYRHYPVNLDLSLSSYTALNNTNSHKVTFQFGNLVFVTNDTVQAYLVLTATTANRSSSMCVHLTVNGVPQLFPNESRPEDLAISEGDAAVFSCDVQTTQIGHSFTVAFHIRPLTSESSECFNCSFSAVDLYNCKSAVKTGLCSEFVVTSSKQGHPSLASHLLTANWARPSSSLSGSEVVCAIASHGITQWARTATLTVLSPSATPQTTAEPPRLLALTAISLLLAVGVAIVVVVVCIRYRHRGSKPTQHHHHTDDETPLSLGSLPSSGNTTPTLPTPLPSIQLEPTTARHRLLQAVQSYSNSFDSGLDFSTTGDCQGSKGGGSYLQVATGCRSNSLVDLSPPSRDVCVYVSYCDSQADWVRETLLPLLLSFQPITVTDHEGHMIAGSIISEERLRLLSSADKVVAVISQDYQLSEWCCYELQHVIQQSPGVAGHLIPILCAGCRELPSTIATLHPLYLEDPNWRQKLRVAVRRQHRHSS